MKFEKINLEKIKSVIKSKMSAAHERPTSRSQVLCPILGKAEDLKTNALPTTAELLKYYLHLKLESNKKKTYRFAIQDSRFSDSNMGIQLCANCFKTPCD